MGWPTRAYEDGRGLFIAGRFHSTEAGQNARTVTAERLAAGMSMGLSIGYNVKRHKFRDGGVRELHELDLLEVSLVTLPANTQALVTGVKCVDCLSRCSNDRPLTEAERSELQDIHMRVLDLEIERLNRGIEYVTKIGRKNRANPVAYAERSPREVCPDLAVKAFGALVAAKWTWESNRRGCASSPRPGRATRSGSRAGLCEGSSAAAPCGSTATTPTRRTPPCTRSHLAMGHLDEEYLDGSQERAAQAYADSYGQ